MTAEVPEVPEVAPGDDRLRRPPRVRPAPRPASRHNSRDLLRRVLASPDVLGQAFLLREVLGPPAGLRPPTQGRAGGP